MSSVFWSLITTVTWLQRKECHGTHRTAGCKGKNRIPFYTQKRTIPKPVSTQRRAIRKSMPSDPTAKANLCLRKGWLFLAKAASPRSVIHSFIHSTNV